MAQSTQQDPAPRMDPRPMPRPEQGAPTKAFPSMGHAYAPGIDQPSPAYGVELAILLIAVGIMIGVVIGHVVTPHTHPKEG